MRLTKDGITFGILKFRCIRVDGERDDMTRLYTCEKDSYVTSVERVIRTCRSKRLHSGRRHDYCVDLVQPEIVAKYEEYLPEFALQTSRKS